MSAVNKIHIHEYTEPREKPTTGESKPSTRVGTSVLAPVRFPPRDAPNPRRLLTPPNVEHGVHSGAPHKSKAPALVRTPLISLQAPTAMIRPVPGGSATAAGSATSALSATAPARPRQPPPFLPHDHTPPPASSASMCVLPHATRFTGRRAKGPSTRVGRRTALTPGECPSRPFLLLPNVSR